MGETWHDRRCCMEGAWPGWGPHPDCPGVAAVEDFATAARPASSGSDQEAGR